MRTRIGEQALREIEKINTEFQRNNLFIRFILIIMETVEAKEIRYFITNKDDDNAKEDNDDVYDDDYDDDDDDDDDADDKDEDDTVSFDDGRVYRLCC